MPGLRYEWRAYINGYYEYVLALSEWGNLNTVIHKTTTVIVSLAENTNTKDHIKAQIQYKKG